MRFLRHCIPVFVLVLLVSRIAVAQDENRADDLYDTARRFHDLGDYARAIELLSQVLVIDPSYVEAYVARASAYIYLEKYNAAYGDYYQAAKIDSAYASGLGYIFAVWENFEQSIHEYRRASAANPERSTPYYWLGNNYYRVGKLQIAILFLNRALELDPQDSYSIDLLGRIYYQMDDYERSVAHFNRFLGLNPETSFSIHYRALTYLELNLLDKALHDFNYILKFEPESSFAYGNRGIIYTELEQYQQAQADYDQSIALDPMNAYAYYNRGVNYEDLGLTALAEADYRQSIAIDPTYAIPHLALAGNYIERGDYAQAQMHYDRFMELSNGIVPRRFIVNKQFIEQSLQNSQVNAFNFRNVAIVILIGIIGYLLFRIRQTTNPTQARKSKRGGR